MRYKFSSWYIQALGASFGILACIYAYMYGYIYIYNNIYKYIDIMSFSSFISSYLILPLCLVVLLLSLVKSIEKYYMNVYFRFFNNLIVLICISVGFLGCRIYFTIPAVFMIVGMFLFDRFLENTYETDDFKIYTKDLNPIDDIGLVNEDIELNIDSLDGTNDLNDLDKTKIYNNNEFKL